MKFVLCWTESDGCTYSSSHVVPIEYEDEIKLHDDLEAVVKYQSASQGLFHNLIKFAGKEFYLNEEMFKDIEIWNLDDWFEEYSK